MSTKGPNPFVGPRPLAYGEHLYGRDAEVHQLRDLLISEQVVLLYSPSGAGKTSLLAAGLCRDMEAASFTVLPIARVGKSIPALHSGPAVSNRYTFSVLTDLEEKIALPLGSDRLQQLTLAEYVELRTGKDDNSVLLLDQFEEFFTVDPLDTDAKQGFFTQLGTALQNRTRRLWLVMAMREEYVAHLDPYCKSIRGYLNLRFRLELLRAAEARQAITKSAADGGILFAEDAARSLIDDLCRIRVQDTDGTLSDKHGEYVEPVHLQVVCRRLWQRLAEDASEIRPSDVREEGSVDSALAAYYDECVAVAAKAQDEGERAIRSWLDKHLITPQGMRAQVLKGLQHSEGMENTVLDRLVDDHLLRAERRRGLIWYELAHDRLIEPILSSNSVWRESYLKPWQRSAEEWAEAGRPPERLLAGDTLAHARAWVVEYPRDATAADREFVEASAREESATRARIRQRRAIRGLCAVLALSALTIGGYHYWNRLQARPWGFLVNLFDGQVYPLDGDSKLIGRPSTTYKPQIAVTSSEISGAHLFIDRNQRVFDIRSLKGTSLNGAFLQDGAVLDLADADVLVLANTVPFQFRGIDYEWWQLSVPKPQVPLIPAAAWAVLIDGVTRRAHYLVEDTYYARSGEQGEIVISTTRESQSGVLLHRQSRAVGQHDGIAIESLPTGGDLTATFKLGQVRAYGTCLVPPGRLFEELSFKSLDKNPHPCAHVDWPFGYDETMRFEQPVENLIFHLGKQGVGNKGSDKESAFRVIPRSN